jgi:hypothetical protein
LTPEVVADRGKCGSPDEGTSLLACNVDSSRRVMILQCHTEVNEKRRMLGTILLKQNILWLDVPMDIVV